MAISAPHYRCLRQLHRRGELPQGGAILEIGEANWYGDISPAEIHREFEEQGGTSSTLIPQLKDVWDACSTVRAIYHLLFRTLSVTSIDLHGTELAIKADLNDPLPLPLGCIYGTVINHGTAEHIFNVCQVFKTMHDHCEVGGLMIHESPFTGWVDHGFWTIQPTAYFDLCDANGYALVFMAVNQIDGDVSIPIESREQIHQMARANAIPANAMLYVALRKQVEGSFKIPMQGVYGGTLGRAEKLAWRELR